MSPRWHTRSGNRDRLTFGAARAGSVALGWVLLTAAEVREATPGSISTPPAAGAPRHLPGTNGMMWIAGGAFWMGSNAGSPDEQPAHQVTVDGFWMDKTEVTNEQFEKFVRATGYVTIAERKPDPKDFPGVPEDKLVPGSVVFTAPSLAELNRERAAEGLDKLNEIPLDDHFLWWRYVPGANWRHPEGPGSDIAGREKLPVVNVAWDD